nr:MAG TPA: hypothetical protein [Caudoviricetes sp.]
MLLLSKPITRVRGYRLRGFSEEDVTLPSRSRSPGGSPS